jgi:hypothetical protein
MVYCALNTHKTEKYQIEEMLNWHIVVFLDVCSGRQKSIKQLV